MIARVKSIDTGFALCYAFFGAPHQKYLPFCVRPVLPTKVGAGRFVLNARRRDGEGHFTPTRAAIGPTVSQTWSRDT